MILAELAKLGFASYEAFMNAFLPRELELRGLAGVTVPVRENATGSARKLLEAGAAIEGQVRGLATDLAAADRQAVALDNQVNAALHSLNRLEEAVANACFVVSGSRDVEMHVAKAAPALEDQCHKIAETMLVLHNEITQTCDMRHGLRAAVSIAQLQAESVCRFAAETIDGREDAHTSNEATHTLVQSLENGIDAMHASIDVDRGQTRKMSAQIKVVESTLRITTLLLTKWRSLVGKSQIRHEMETLLPVLDDALASLVHDMSALHETAEDFASSVVAFETAGLQSRLDQILALNMVEA